MSAFSICFLGSDWLIHLNEHDTTMAREFPKRIKCCIMFDVKVRKYPSGKGDPTLLLRRTGSESCSLVTGQNKGCWDFRDSKRSSCSPTGVGSAIRSQSSVVAGPQAIINRMDGEKADKI